MGLRAVGDAYREAHRLGDKHAAVRLLIWMAYLVTDEPQGAKPALTFFAGWQTAATGLGYNLPELDDPDRARAAQTAVKRSQRALEAAGLIERVSRSAPKHAAVWRLTLDPRAPVDNSDTRSHRGGRRQTGTGVEQRATGVEDRPVQGSVFDLNRGRSSTPLSVGPNSPDRPARIERARARASTSFDPFAEPFPTPVDRRSW